MFKEILIKNNAPVLIEKKQEVNHNPKYEALAGSLLERLHSYGKDIQEKAFGRISSFNFSKDVFFDGNWNDITIKARGLFLNNETGKIVARGYEKFFAYKEKKFNSPEWLEQNLKFPVTAYIKYNGFLGILGFDENGLLFCSKSTVGGEYAEIFKRIFHKHAHDEEHLLNYMKENNTGLIFEVIDPVNDSHIVQYSNERIVLLDAISLEEDFKNYDYDKLNEIGNKFNFMIKEKYKVFNDWDSLKAFLEEQERNNTDAKEGYVLVDSNNYHFKLKTAWYKFWKWMRSKKDNVTSGRPLKLEYTDNPDAVKFIGWMTKQDKEWLQNHSIIETRNSFFTKN